jgi:hypothetical protein
MCVSPCNDECEVTTIKAEPDTDIQIKVEEIPEPISFPEIKDEPDEVSYVSVSPVFRNGYLSWSAHLNNPSVGMEISVLSWVI